MPRVLGDFTHDFGPGAAGLPQLEPLGRHIDGQGLLEQYFHVARAIAVGAQFLNQGKFLEGAVELGPQHVLDNFCFQRHILAHAAPLDDHVQRFAGDGFGGDLIDGACAGQLFPVCPEPLGGIPVFRLHVA